MFHHIAGDLVALSPTRVVIEAAGVGYEASIPFSTYSAIRARCDDGAGASVKLLTHLLVREDSYRLFGFASEEERDLFRAVIRVNGLGPAAALAILSSLDVARFREVLEAGDAAFLERIKGIGKKLAQRLVLELKDYLKAPTGGGGGPTGLPPRGGENGSGVAVRAAAEQALLELGFSRKDATARVERVVAELRGRRQDGEDPLLPSVEEILFEALRLG